MGFPRATVFLEGRLAVSYMRIAGHFDVRAHTFHELPWASASVHEKNPSADSSCRRISFLLPISA